VAVVLHDARKLDADGQVDGFWLLADGGSIRRTGTGEPQPADEMVDAAGGWLVPGFIDLHCHSGGGHSFDDGPGAVEAGLAVHRDRGAHLPRPARARGSP